jgi:DNA-binding MarR family transcriptional regulator
VSPHRPHNLIDETIHQRTRLAIMATLAPVQSLDFNELKAQLGLTDGNLSTHLSSLERAGYVRITKSFRGRKPLTTVAQTPKGRKALADYVNLLQGILEKARPGDKGATR